MTFSKFVFGTISWFTMSREVENSGLQMTAEGQLFTISAMPSPYFVGIYDDSGKATYVRDKLLTGASKGSDVITWTITEDIAETNQQTNTTTITHGKNIGNGPASGYTGGISPGSSGELQFKIIPNSPVNAQFSFVLYAYSVDYDNSGNELPNTIAIIDSNSTPAEKITASNLLNGHILLFKNYNTTTNKYSGLISTRNDLTRLMTGTYSSETTVSVYWVWPETLSELVLDDTNDNHKRNLRGKNSLCSNQSETIELLKSHPDWFLLDPETENKTWTEFTSSTANATVVNTINNNYTLYSSYYNEADQCIGTNVAYLMLDMTADGTGATGG